MFNLIRFIYEGNLISGYGQHASQFWNELRKLVPENSNMIPDENSCTIVLGTVDDPVFYRNYVGTKIAFNVWESTLYPDHFFKKLLEFDQLWVVSQWAKECVIRQGYPKDRVKVIPEGVDTNLFRPLENKPVFTFTDPRFQFQFYHVGRWEDRKFTKEIIEAFVEAFPCSEYPSVSLVLSVDNPFPVDGFNSTKERLKHYGFDKDNRIIPLSFLTRSQYLQVLNAADIFITCARAEGWNLPLIEAMACGIPSICSQYGAQLDFHKEKDMQVKIKEHHKPVNVYGMLDCPGTWAEPDKEHLKSVMEYAYQNIVFLKHKFSTDVVEFLKENFSWTNAAKIAYDVLKQLADDKKINNKPAPKTAKQSASYNFHFINGAFFEITKVAKDSCHHVKFIDKDTDRIEYEVNINGSGWAKTKYKYFKNMRIIVTNVKTKEVILNHLYDATDKRVLVSFNSSSIGDNLAWMPYVEEFRKKHNCKMIASTFFNDWFKKMYPEIEFVKKNSAVPNLYAQYNIGVECGDNANEFHPIDWRTIPLQKVASDILGLEFEEIKPKIDTSTVYIQKVKRPTKYVCISEHSTAACKYWHYPNGWQELVDKLNQAGYNVVVISYEATSLKNVINATGNHMSITMGLLMGCEFYIGLASGLAWLAWALGKQVVMISGFSEPFVEFQSGNIRIAGKGECTGCLNDIFIPQRSWDEGCFHNLDFSCTKNITPQMVFDQLPERVNKERKVLDFTTAPIMRHSHRQTSFKIFLSELYATKSSPNIVEIGTMRRTHDDPDLPGDGGSTAVFSWFVMNYGGDLRAVDISEQSLTNCEKTLKHMGLWMPDPCLKLIQYDGIRFLAEYPRKIDALYIDAFDYDKGKERESAQFHLDAFKEAEKNLEVGALIMFDDIIGPNYKGKPELVIPYAVGSGNYSIVYEDYQIILRKTKDIIQSESVSYKRGEDDE